MRHSLSTASRVEKTARRTAEVVVAHHLQRAGIEDVLLAQHLPPNAYGARGDQDDLPPTAHQCVQLLHQRAQAAQREPVVRVSCHHRRANLGRGGGMGDVTSKPLSMWMLNMRNATWHALVKQVVTYWYLPTNKVAARNSACMLHHSSAAAPLHPQISRQCVAGCHLDDHTTGVAHGLARVMWLAKRRLCALHEPVGHVCHRHVGPLQPCIRCENQQPSASCHQHRRGQDCRSMRSASKALLQQRNMLSEGWASTQKVQLTGAEARHVRRAASQALDKWP